MEDQRKHKLFGLLGKNISYSFSQGYFTSKFENEKIHNVSYQNFDIPSIDFFSKVISTQNLKGLNVTIPYKETVFPFLDDIDTIANRIGAVNTISIQNGKTKGYNTDVIGFQKSLKPLLKPHHNRALILGTGGASKAVDFVLRDLGIQVLKVSRNSTLEVISYQQINQEILNQYTIIINTTPLGTFPNVADCPELPYQFLTKKHLLYDLIYNPSMTRFLKLGRKHGAHVKNGLEMLELQAEASWKIWNQNLI